MEEESRLLAEFLGWEKCEKCGEVMPEHYNYGEKNWQYHALKNFEFHKNWKWLMPVILKIGEIEMPDDEYPNGNRKFVSQIYPRTFGMKNEEGLYMFRFNGYFLHQEKELIKAAYKACIEVLKHEKHLK